MKSALSKENEPYISAIVPFFNVDKYARDCVESLIHQDYYNCEFIFVDDGSTDDTLSILNSYENDERVKIFHKNNGGLSDARNFGLSKAKGEFITFIDGDDYVHPHYLRELARANEGRKDRVVISKLKVVKYKEKMNAEDVWENDISYYQMDRREVFKKVLYDELSVSACGKLVPKTAYNDIKFPVGRVSEEVATIGKILRKYKTFSVIKQPLYGYVMRNNSIGHKKEIPYAEINDRIDAYSLFAKIINEEFDLENDKQMNNALQYGWAHRYVDMANMYENVIDNKEASREVKMESIKWLKANIKSILKNMEVPLKQKIRIGMFTYFPKQYNFLYLMYIKIRYNI